MLSDSIMPTKHVQDFDLSQLHALYKNKLIKHKSSNLTSWSLCDYVLLATDLFKRIDLFAGINVHRVIINCYNKFCLT